MSVSLHLQITPSGTDRTLSRDQKRFNALIRQIGESRATLEAWHESLARYRQSYLALVVPLQKKLRVELRRWALALDAAAAEIRLARGDRQALEQILTTAAADLLSNDATDPEILAVFERHAGMEYETAQQELLAVMKDLAEAGTGLDPGAIGQVASEEELVRQEHERLRSQEAAREEQRAVGARSRRTSAARQRRQEEARRVSQSVREVFRKLASALHPDREPDPAQRAAKTALMAQVNDAYAREDLLALLELQLRIEQIDPEHLANVDAARLKHYNKVLAEQLSELKMEIRRCETDFQLDFGGAQDGSPDPRRLGKELERMAAHLRRVHARLQLEVDMFADDILVKRWLKAQRGFLRTRTVGP